MILVDGRPEKIQSIYEQGNNSKLIFKSQPSLLFNSVAQIVFIILIMATLLTFLIMKNGITILNAIFGVAFIIALIFFFFLFSILRKYEMFGIQLYSDKLVIRGKEIFIDTIDSIYWIKRQTIENGDIFIAKVHKEMDTDIIFLECPLIKNVDALHKEMMNQGLEIIFIQKENANYKIKKLSEFKTGKIKLKNSSELNQFIDKYFDNPIGRLFKITKDSS